MGAISVGNAVLKISPSFQGFKKEAQAKLDAAMKGQSLEVDVTLRNAQKIRTELEALAADKTAKIEVNADTGKAVSELDAAARNRRTTLNADADTGKAEAQLDGVAKKPREARIKADADIKEAEAKLFYLQSLQSISLFNIGNIAAASALIGGMAAQIGGLVAAAGAASAALGAIAGTTVVGGLGVFGAFKALRKQQASAAADSKSQADAQATAIRAVEDAQRRAADAAKDLETAQRTMNDSWAQGARELRDMNAQLDETKHSQEGAAIALARAKENRKRVNRDRSSSRLDKQEADLRVREALTALNSAQNKHRDQKIDTAAANRAGVGGTKAVTSARAGLDSALQRQVDAQRALARAIEQSTKKQDAQSRAADAFNEAMKKLSPNARDFVTQVRNLGGLWKDVRMDVETRLFANLGNVFSRVAREQLPELSRGMNDLATFTNGMFIDTLKRVSATFTEFSGNGTFDRFLSGTKASFSGFVPVVDSVFRALTNMVADIGPSIGVMFQNMARYINQSTPFWTKLGTQSMNALSGMFPILGRLLNALQPLIDRAFPLMVTLFDKFTIAIENNQGRLADLAGVGGDLAEAYLGVFERLLPLVTPMLEGLAAVLNNPVGRNFFAAFIIGKMVFSTMINPIANVANGFLTINRAVGFVTGRSSSLKTTLDRLNTTLQNLAIGTSGYGGKADVAAAKTGRFAAVANHLRRNTDAATGSTARLSGATVTLQNGVTGATGKMAVLGATTEKTGWRALVASTKFRRFMGAAAGIGAMVALMSLSASDANAAIDENGNAVQKSGTDWKMLGLQLALFAPMLGGLGSGLIKLAKSQAVVTAATKAWAVVQAAFNLIMSANPIALVVIAIAALVAGAVLAYNKVGWFRTAVDAVWGAIKTAAAWVWKFKEYLLLLLGPIGAVILAGIKIVQNWDKIKEAATKVGKWIVDRFNEWINFVGGLPARLAQKGANMFTWLRDAFKNALNWIIRKWNDLEFKFKIPGTGKTIGISTPNLRTFAKGGAFRDADGVLHGPGTATSDDILMMNSRTGLPMAWAADTEMVVNGRGAQKHRGLVDAINRDDPRLAALPRFAKGGAFKSLGAKSWNTAWDRYFNGGKGGADRALDGSGLNADRSQRVLNADPKLRSAYERGDLPPGMTLDQVMSLPGVAADQANREQIKREVAESERRNGIRKANEKAFNQAWFQFFEKHGGDVNKDKFLSRPANQEYLERYKSGQWPDGSRSIDDIDTPASNDSASNDSASNDSSNNDSSNNSSKDDDQKSGDYSAGGDDYGLDAATNIAYGAKGFPQWVTDLGEKYNMLPGTYANHQVKGSLNRGIDWQPKSGPFTAGGNAEAQKFAEMLRATARNGGQPEQVIWMNPDTGSQVGSADGRDVGPGTDQPGYYRDDWTGHRDHVHTRFTKSIAPTLLENDDDDSNLPDSGSGNTDDDSNLPDSGSGNTDDDPDPNDNTVDTKGDGDGRENWTPSLNPVDSEIDGVFSGAEYAKNVGATVAPIFLEGALDFFGLKGSIVDTDGNEYWQAIRNGIRQDKDKRKKKDGDSKSNSDSAGSGDPDDPKTKKLQGRNGDDTKPNDSTGFKDNTADGKIAAGTPGAKQAVWSEWTRRGWNTDQQWDSTLRLINGESGWNVTAQNGSSGAYGLFQFLGDDKRKRWPQYFTPDAKAQAGPGGDYILERYKTPAAAWEFWQNPVAKGADAGLTAGSNGHWYANGGWVRGKGTKRSDDIDARLSNGEFVVNADSARHNAPLLEAINSNPRAALAPPPKEQSKTGSLLSEGVSGMIDTNIDAAGDMISAIPIPGSEMVGESVKQSAGAIKAGVGPLINGATDMVSQFLESNFGLQASPVLTNNMPSSPAQTSSKTIDNSVTNNVQGENAKDVVAELKRYEANKLLARGNRKI